jgi:hypothetical protein
VPPRRSPPTQTRVTWGGELGGLDALGGEIARSARRTRDRIEPDDIGWLIGTEGRLLRPWANRQMITSCGGILGLRDHRRLRATRAREERYDHSQDEPPVTTA